MPIAPIIAPGSSLVASSAVIRSGTLVITRNTGSVGGLEVEPTAVDFSYDGATIPSTTLPSLMISVAIRAYYSGSISSLNNTCLPMVNFLPLISTGIADRGYPLCMPFAVYENSVATFTIRAPIEKLGFRAYNGVSQYVSGFVLPPLPDLCYTEVNYTVSASQ